MTKKNIFPNRIKTKLRCFNQWKFGCLDFQRRRLVILRQFGTAFNFTSAMNAAVSAIVLMKSMFWHWSYIEGYFLPIMQLSIILFYIFSIHRKVGYTSASIPVECRVGLGSVEINHIIEDTLSNSFKIFINGVNLWNSFSP